jgi:hypothetical protein
VLQDFIGEGIELVGAESLELRAQGPKLLVKLGLLIPKKIILFNFYIRFFFLNLLLNKELFFQVDLKDFFMPFLQQSSTFSAAIINKKMILI